MRRMQFAIIPVYADCQVILHLLTSSIALIFFPILSPRRDSYNLHPYVKSGVFNVALNGTLRSSDIVNVTVTVPDDLAPSITNVTAAGYSYIQFAFDNVTGVDVFQVRSFPTAGIHVSGLCTAVVLLQIGIKYGSKQNLLRSIFPELVHVDIHSLSASNSMTVNLLLTALQAQIPATGVVTLVHNPKTLFVYASTNGSALLDGDLADVYLNVASSQPVVVTNAERVRLALHQTYSGTALASRLTALLCTPLTQAGSSCTYLLHTAGAGQEAPAGQRASAALQTFYQQISWGGGAAADAVQNGPGFGVHRHCVGYYQHCHDWHRRCVGQSDRQPQPDSARFFPPTRLSLHCKRLGPSIHPLFEVWDSGTSQNSESEQAHTNVRIYALSWQLMLPGLLHWLFVVFEGSGDMLQGRARCWPA